MSENLFLQLLSKLLAGEASKEEIRQLEEFTASNPEWMSIYNQLTGIHQPNSPEDDLKAEQAFALHSLKMQLYNESSTVSTPKYNRLSSVRNKILTAAVSVLIVAAGLTTYLYYSHDAKPAQLSVVSTKRGSRTSVTLPDGTIVSINSQSRLQYSDNFKGKIREVWLSGEAFFDVKKDPDHPFVIHTNKINIRVLGTAFNVKSYPEDPTIETSLIRGRIEVNFNDRPSETIILRPNEKLTVSKDQSQFEKGPGAKDSKIKLENLNPINKDKLFVETAWLSNRIAFTDTRLADICSTLERRFNIEIEFENKELRDYRYTGIFEEENLDQILNVMKLSKPFNYSTYGKKITLTF